MIYDFFRAAGLYLERCLGDVFHPGKDIIEQVEIVIDKANMAIALECNGGGVRHLSCHELSFVDGRNKAVQLAREEQCRSGDLF